MVRSAAYRRWIVREFPIWRVVMLCYSSVTTGGSVVGLAHVLCVYKCGWLCFRAVSGWVGSQVLEVWFPSSAGSGRSLTRGRREESAAEQEQCRHHWCTGIWWSCSVWKDTILSHSPRFYCELVVVVVGFLPLLPGCTVNFLCAAEYIALLFY